jgi:uncharacterized repeat protein (TIGR01451 family)
VAANGEGTSRGWGPQGQKIFTIGATGWNPASTTACTSAGFTTANCNAGLAYTYGDTGIFYSTRPDTAFFANGSTIATLANGYLINPSSNLPWPGVGGGTTTPRIHNKWDAVHVNAFGTALTPFANGFSALEETKVNPLGRGATPFNAGSPVAGPDSGLQWDRYGQVGPWNRISYPGSCIANNPAAGPANGAGSVVPQAAGAAVNSVDACVVTSAGRIVSDAALLPAATNALRFAVGGLYVGETKYAKIRVKIVNAANLSVANWEGHGGDSGQGLKASNDNPWRYWVGAVGNLRLGAAKLIIDNAIIAVNGVPYNGTSVPPSATIRYRVTYANAYAGAQTNVALSDILPAQAIGTSNFTVKSGPNIIPATLPTGGTFSFAVIPTLGTGGGGVVEFDVATNAVLGNSIVSVARINSTQVPTLATSSVTTTVAAPPAVVAANDSVTGINGASGAANVLNAFTGDTVNGAVATNANASVSLAPGAVVPAGLVFNMATGDVSVAANTAAGVYSFNYSICELGSTTNCKTAIISVTVILPPVVAIDDSVTGIDGVSGATDVLNAFTGDTINGASATTANAILALAPGTIVPAGLTFDTVTGNVSVDAGTAAGVYSFDYQLCDSTSPTSCDIGTVTVTVVGVPQADLAITKSNGTGSVTAGSTTTYTLTITNNGPASATGALVKDAPGAGITCPAANPVTITGNGIPVGSFTVGDLTGAGITLGTLTAGQSTTLSYACEVN